MKKLLIILVSILFVSCAGKMPEETFNYTITYTDGTTEEVVTNERLGFRGYENCIETIGCGCGGENKFKRCGVRKYEITKEEIKSEEVDSTEIETLNLKN